MSSSYSTLSGLLGQASITQDQALQYLAQNNIQSQHQQNQLAAQQQNYIIPAGSKITSSSAGSVGSIIYADDKPQYMQESKPLYRKTLLSFNEVMTNSHQLGLTNRQYLDQKYGKNKWHESCNTASYEIIEEIPAGTKVRMTTYSGLAYDPSGKSWTSHTQTAIIPDKKEKKHYMDSLKQYFGKHKDLFITMAVIFLADHFLFGGKFKQKITESVEKLLDKSIKTLQGDENGQK